MENKKQILENLCEQLKSIGSDNFAHARVYEIWNKDFGYCLQSNGGQYIENSLSFVIDDGSNLKLFAEYWTHDGRLLGNDGYGYTLGEPIIENIIFAHDIFYNEGKGKYGGSGKSMIELLSDHKKFSRVKSAGSIL